MLSNLGWENYIPVVEDSIQTTNLLDTLVDLSDGKICPVGKAIMLPKSENGYTTVYREIIESTIFKLQSSISLNRFKTFRYL